MALRNVLLTLLHHAPASGYDLTKGFDKVAGHFWRASHQQVYRALSRMQDEGLVEAHTVVQEARPDKKVYTITPAGLARLRDWLARPTVQKRSNDEALVKLLGADLVGADAVIHDLKSQKRAHRLRLARYRAIESAEYPGGAEGKSPYDRMAYLALLKGIKLEEARAAWAGEAVRLLQQWK